MHTATNHKGTKKINRNQKAEGNRQLVEHGDIFFFYRPKIDAEEVKGIENVQRFYLVTFPEGSEIYRVFMIGQKQLPEIIESTTSSEARNWALNILTTSDANEIRKEFLPVEYKTETRGTRRVGMALPAGEGKYSIVMHGGHSELAYILELPQTPGPTQNEFQIKKEASYIVSVKNPDIQVPGYTAFLKKSQIIRNH